MNRQQVSPSLFSLVLGTVGSLVFFASIAVPPALAELKRDHFDDFGFERERFYSPEKEQFGPFFPSKKKFGHGGRFKQRDRRARLAIKQTLDSLEDGRKTFRFDTLGNEGFWGETLRLHETVAQLSPRTALELGLKVDSNALPRRVIRAIKRNRVDLNDPAVTKMLLKRNAVVGVKGFFDDAGQLSSIGIQCTLCHSEVDNSVAPGIGRRLDGWANRDINVGAIISSAPNLQPFVDLLGPFVDLGAEPVETVRSVFQSWGPGRFDSALLFDGIAFQPNGNSASVLIPPVFGLAGVNLHTWTGWGSVAHWAALVSSLELNGKGTFFDPRLDNAEQFPIAAENGFSDVRNDPDLVTPKLPALHLYILSLRAPTPPRNSFDRQAAKRGKEVFNNQGDCARCHVPPLFTEPGWNLHTPEEIGIDGFVANRSPERAYRTAPLKGLFSHTKGGFFHDARFPTLLDVINHYETTFNLGLGEQQKSDLIQYLLSL
ncbi:MAG: hypothetical protein ACPGYT_02015 [Nitrospirales bacterium]